MSPEAPQVLIAPDKFKACATADEVAHALASGVRRAAPHLTVEELPIADGGDGTLEAYLRAGYRSTVVESATALREPSTTLAAVRGDHAVVELASTCGLAQLAGAREPLRASSYGLGVALRRLVEHRFRRITLALGGSASTDGGLGLLDALGARGIDADGRVVTPDGAGLLRLAHLDMASLRWPADVSLEVLTDVAAPLTGPDGAAQAYGPQKGAGPATVEALDAALGRWARQLERRRGIEPSATAGAGAAGGVGAAAMALGARVTPGSDAILELLGFDAALSQSHLVVTGEGSWDRQSLDGKGPGEVVRRAQAAGRRAVVVAGVVESGCLPDGVEGHELSELVGSRQAAIEHAQELLVAVGETIGAEAARAKDGQPGR
ncbi:MAG: glycerate kinase [Actinomycetales bacterium]|nr:glycerate kinase [Actinomycetales bacterium]